MDKIYRNKNVVVTTDGIIEGVDFFKNDFGNTLLLFLGVLTLVFGKAGTILGGFVSNGISRLATLSTAMADFAGRAGNLNLAPVEIVRKQLEMKLILLMLVQVDVVLLILI